MKCDFSGRRVLVTGAAKGIGTGIAEAFSESGAELFLHYRSDPAAAERLAERLGGKVHLFRADLSRTDGVDGLFSEIDRVMGGLDAAVNNAGWDPGFVDTDSITSELYEKLTGMNVRGTLFCCLRELQRMRMNPDGGSIINIGSVQYNTTIPGRVLYALSKGAVHSMTGALALEGGPCKVRVNSIAPGYIEVERMTSTPGYDHAATCRTIPVGRTGTPRDIGDLCLFLCSPEAGFINGQTLVSDGGVNRKLARQA